MLRSRGGFASIAAHLTDVAFPVISHGLQIGEAGNRFVAAKIRDMNVQGIRQDLKDSGFFRFIAPGGNQAISIAVHTKCRVHIDAGLGIFKGDSQLIPVQLLADDDGRRIVDGADMLVLCFDHSVFVCGLYFQRSVSVKGSGIDLSGVLFKRHRVVVKLHSEGREGQMVF